MTKAYTIHCKVQMNAVSARLDYLVILYPRYQFAQYTIRILSSKLSVAPVIRISKFSSSATESLSRSRVSSALLREPAPNVLSKGVRYLETGRSSWYLRNLSVTLLVGQGIKVVSYRRIACALGIQELTEHATPGKARERLGTIEVVFRRCRVYRERPYTEADNVKVFTQKLAEGPINEKDVKKKKGLLGAVTKYVIPPRM